MTFDEDGTCASASRELSAVWLRLNGQRWRPFWPTGVRPNFTTAIASERTPKRWR